jgi:hypothetical protein
MKSGQFGSFIPFKERRRFLFLFTKTDGWWGKYLKGYTHVCLMEYINQEFAIGFEPALAECRTIFRTVLTRKDIELLEDWTILELTVLATKENRLIKPLFQTCATIVQYLAGISLGCILVNSLYNKLTKSSHKWLESKGVYGVTTWVKSQKV